LTLMYFPNSICNKFLTQFIRKILNIQYPWLQSKCTLFTLSRMVFPILFALVISFDWTMLSKRGKSYLDEKPVYYIDYYMKNCIHDLYHETNNPKYFFFQN